MDFRITLKPIVLDPFFRDDNITIYARVNSHLQGYRQTIEASGYPHKMQSYSFVIKTRKSRIIYSGDIGSLDDYADLLPECNLLITEGMHLDLDRLFEKVASHKVENLILTHLPANVYKKPGPAMHLAAKWGVENLHIADDGFRMKI
jgi:ribonuclease BN (tRNA processing enzyme)